METQDAKVTPAIADELADLSSYFGIRPGTFYTGTLPVFDGLPEAQRPRVTIEFMTSTARAEYAERMSALDTGKAPDGETPDARLERIQGVLRAKRVEHDAINEWLIKKHLVSIDGYPDATRPGQFIDIKREGEQLSVASWEALAYALRPHVATFIIDKNFISMPEANAVKS